MLLNHEDQGSGPTVVLLHGFPLDHTIWSPQIAALSTHHRVIAPDLRGHGKTEAPGGIYTMDAMADDVIELLDTLRLVDPVVLGGHSMGGYVALSAVLRYPSRFRGLMLMNTRAKGDSPEVAERRLNSVREIESNGETEGFVASMIPRLFPATTIAESPHLVERTETIMARTNPRAIIGALRGMAQRPDRSGELPKISIPTLVFTGEYDAISPPDEAAEIAGHLPNASLQILAGTGHMAPIEKEEETNQVLLHFLKKLDGV